MTSIVTVQDFSKVIAKILKSDRWVLVACDGEQGEGKSCFTDQLAKANAKLTKTPFSHEDNMTYQRKELKDWIDGNRKEKIKRKPEYSNILADELISMFFKRNWYDAEQIDGIELLNKCRDRHLCVLGNIPNFWDLDSAIYPIVTFWAHIHERGRAWIFEKDKNPFATDKWHRLANYKAFKKQKHPYRTQGFVCEIQYPDWTAKEKAEYYHWRNIKRRNTEGQRAKTEKYRDIKIQRDELIRLAFKLNEKLTNKDLHNVVPSLSAEAIRLIRHGER